jgi:hypothetical protein
MKELEWIGLEMLRGGGSLRPYSPSWVVRPSKKTKKKKKIYSIVPDTPYQN